MSPPMRPPNHAPYLRQCQRTVAGGQLGAEIIRKAGTAKVYARSLETDLQIGHRGLQRKKRRRTPGSAIGTGEIGTERRAKHKLGKPADVGAVHTQVALAGNRVGGALEAQRTGEPVSGGLSLDIRQHRGRIVERQRRRHRQIGSQTAAGQWQPIENGNGLEVSGLEGDLEKTGRR
ncbi:MAG: hypothetical protein RID59_21310, partial [Hoeflea sp.]